MNHDFNQKIAVPAKISRFRLIAPRFTKKSPPLANNWWISQLFWSFGEIEIITNNIGLSQKEKGLVKDKNLRRFGREKTKRKTSPSD